MCLAATKLGLRRIVRRASIRAVTARITIMATAVFHHRKIDPSYCNGKRSGDLPVFILRRDLKNASQRK
jgi:hypothetical protein